MVFCQFLFGWHNWLSCNHPANRFPSADTNRKLRRADAGIFLSAIRFFYNAVFQRMECDDAESAAFCQAMCCLIDGSLQHIQFSIDFNSNCLKSTFCRMGTVFSGSLWHSFFDNIHQFSGGFDGLVGTLCHNKLRNAFCPAFFPISKNDTIQIGFAVCIDYIISAERLCGIHTHVQWRVLLIGETTFRLIQLMRRYPDIHKHAVNTVNAKLVQYGTNIAKIVMYKSDLIQ